MAVLRLQCLGVVAILAIASVAFGDGCYMPERAVRKIPAIPAQRAVLSWRDGQETLVISSALDSESQKLGWIIPLPAVPVTIEREYPGALKTLGFCVQPEITHDLHSQVTFAVYVFFFASLALATVLFKKKPLGFLLIEVFLFVILPALTLSASGVAGSTAAKAANVLVEKSVSVGDYDVNILKPAKSADLSDWLVRNRFQALQPTAEKTVADYISNGWVFAAIKLTRAESGSNVPHPIKMMFPSREPVYPLKLTASAGGSTAFEIFVIANDSAACKPLEEEFCDRFQVGENTEYSSDAHYETKKCFVGETSKQTIGHPAICSLMWNNCILTKFFGTIKADDMIADLQFDWKPFKSYRQHFFTDQGARQFAWLLFVCMTGCWIGASMVACRASMVKDWGLIRYLSIVFFPAAVLFAVIAAIGFVRCPKLASSEVARGSWFLSKHHTIILHDYIKSTLEENPKILHGTEKEIGESLIKLRSDTGEQRTRQNAVMGTDILLEDSPGNFTVEKSDKKIIVRVYDMVGRPMLIEHPIPDAGKQGRGGQGAEKDEAGGRKGKN
jgi:Uncharacterized protein conserved in bacteria (DUF2330)